MNQPPEQASRRPFSKRANIAIILCLTAVLLLTAGVWLGRSLASNALNDRIFHGGCINLPLTPEGEAYLTSALAQTLDLPETDVALTSRTYEPLKLHYTTMSYYGLAESLQEHYAQREFDKYYATCDYLLIAGIIPQPLDSCISGYVNLHKILSQEQKGRLLGCLRYTGVGYVGYDDLKCILVELTHTDFAKDCILSDDLIYLYFPLDNAQEDRIVAFLDHLMAWQSPN